MRYELIRDDPIRICSELNELELRGEEMDKIG